MTKLPLLESHDSDLKAQIYHTKNSPEEDMHISSFQIWLEACGIQGKLTLLSQKRSTIIIPNFVDTNVGGNPGYRANPKLGLVILRLN